MKEKTKHIKTNDQVLEKFEQLKKITSIESDSELFSYIVSEFIEFKKKNIIESCENVLNELKQIKAEIEKQNKKSSFWKRIFGS